jgi:hypothetical protein
VASLVSGAGGEGEWVLRGGLHRFAARGKEEREACVARAGALSTDSMVGAYFGLQLSRFWSLSWKKEMKDGKGETGKMHHLVLAAPCDG